MEILWSLLDPAPFVPWLERKELNLVSYAHLKAYLVGEGLTPKDLQFATTKPALIERAEMLKIDLEPLLILAASWAGQSVNGLWGESCTPLESMSISELLAHRSSPLEKMEAQPGLTSLRPEMTKLLVAE